MLKRAILRDGVSSMSNTDSEIDQFVPQHLIDVNEVVKAYLTPVGDFIALDGAIYRRFCSLY